jgi:DNA repair protein RecN (Recombination protein N)
MGRLLGAVAAAAEHDDRLSELHEQATGLTAEVGELAIDLRRAADDVEHDPSALDAAEQRGALLGDLRRKFGDTLEDVVAYGHRAASRAEEIARLLDRADDLDAEIEKAEAVAGEAGAALQAARAASAERLSQSAAGHLTDLGFSEPVVEITADPADPGPLGADRISLRFASDRSLEPGPVARIASGGELSRLVLAVRLAGGIADAPVVAFDEIDAGIGGATALAMGEKLAALAEGRQVLVVTHLPQVAAFAATHLVVDREGTTATVRRVEASQRVEELARMLGGLPKSERGKEHAEELLGIAAATQ